MPNDTPPATTGFGKRVQFYRTRAGQTRAVLGGLVGRSAEWVKAIENGRLGVPGCRCCSDSPRFSEWMICPRSPGSSDCRRRL